MTREQTKAAWLCLAFTKGIGPKTCERLICRFGSPEKALAASREELTGGGLLSARLAKTVAKRRESISENKKLVRYLTHRGISIITRPEKVYPRSLLQLTDPPPVILARGERRILTRKSVAIIGTTKPSNRGASIAKRIAMNLSNAGCSVVSGYARGIDTAGHLGALNARGNTILVIPTGIHTFRWRPSFQCLQGADEHALILSERHPDEHWSTGNAIARNRLVVALSDAVIFVETLARPATKETFRLARQLGKPVFVVKYRRTPASAAGNTTLLKMGGIPLQRYKDVEAILKSRPIPIPVQGELDW